MGQADRQTNGRMPDQCITLSAGRSRRDKVSIRDGCQVLILLIVHSSNSSA